MDIIKEVGNEDLKILYLRDGQAILEALMIKDFNEEKYRILRKYIKEKLGEEFTSITSINGSKALIKVLSISADLMNDVVLNDVINMEAEKASNWLNNGLIKELADKAINESNAKAKVKKKRRKKSKSRRKRSKRSRSRKSS